MRNLCQNEYLHLLYRHIVAGGQGGEGLRGGEVTIAIGIGVMREGARTRSFADLHPKSGQPLSWPLLETTPHLSDCVFLKNRLLVN